MATAFFHVLALENILVSLTKEISDGPFFAYKIFLDRCVFLPPIYYSYIFCYFVAKNRTTVQVVALSNQSNAAEFCLVYGKAGLDHHERKLARSNSKRDSPRNTRQLISLL